MIVNFIKIVTEYLGMILCIHKVAGKKIKLSWCSLLYFACWVILIFLGENFPLGKLVLYAYLFLYVRIGVVDSWKHAIKPFAVTMCAIPMLQLLIFATISESMRKIFDVYVVVISVNIIIIFFFLLWKKRYLFTLMNIISKFREIIFVVLFIFLFKCIYSYFLQYKRIDAFYMDQLAICFLIIALMLILWINSENEKRHKAEELRTYQLYTKTFEDAVTTIRMKQHEFDNHINAIKCMRYTIKDKEELFNEQDRYYDRILRDNKYNKLLKLKISPILTGYLYSKFTAASAYGIT